MGDSGGRGGPERPVRTAGAVLGDVERFYPIFSDCGTLINVNSLSPGVTDDPDPVASDASGATYRLYAEFRIVPSDTVSCPLDDGDGIDDVNQSFLGDECHLQTTTRADDSTGSNPEVVHWKERPGPACHCRVFLEFDCVPQITELGDGHLIVETYLPDRERLTALVEELRAVTDAVSLRRLTRTGATDPDRSDPVTLDLSEVTEKQREAVSLAIASGYYRTPREAGMGELADELGISKSAMSRRLNAVESKLAVAAFG